MTIILDLTPDIEQGLLVQAQAKGVSLADFVEEIVKRQASQSAAATPTPAAQAKNLYELFAPVRGLLTDEEVDTLFARNRSLSRPVDFRMSGFLVDTNVISEVLRAAPDPQVAVWSQRVPKQQPF